MEVVFDDEGLTLRTESSEGGLPWADFAKIQRQSGFWIFRTAPSRAVLLPERALDATASAELEAFLRVRKLMQWMNLEGPVDLVAQTLLGMVLVRGEVVLRITEVEAYGGPGGQCQPRAPRPHHPQRAHVGTAGPRLPLLLLRRALDAERGDRARG